MPAAPAAAELWSVTRTADELSVLCPWDEAPEGARLHGPLAALRVEGVLDFELVGVLESLLAPLRGAGLSVLALSTWDTDYLLVAEAEAAAA
ncbi:MAG: ACT domain-containing protein, partial [Thermoanaerobaculia bacterium]|nr:ACT domain-containing protein [Thermoanaerobaculia bacterium]